MIIISNTVIFIVVTTIYLERGLASGRSVGHKRHVDGTLKQYRRKSERTVRSKRKLNKKNQRLKITNPGYNHPIKYRS